MTKKAIDISCLYKDCAPLQAPEGINPEVNQGTYATLGPIFGDATRKVARSALEFCRIGPRRIQIFDAKHWLSAA